MAECTIDDLFSSDDGCARLSVTTARGDTAGKLQLSVVALKQGNAERSSEDDPSAALRRFNDFGRRVSRWYMMETSSHDRIVIEEDLRESRYVFEVPSQVLCMPPHLCRYVVCSGFADVSRLPFLVCFRCFLS